jgi:hypothetical protein
MKTESLKNMEKKTVINIKEILESRGTSIKFAGCIPEGFVLIHEDALKELKDFDVWKKWKNDEISIESLNQIHFENETNILKEK